MTNATARGGAAPGYLPSTRPQAPWPTVRQWNLAQDERIPQLVASTPSEYETIVSRLVSDAEFLDQAKRDTVAFARSRPLKKDYAAAAHAAIQALVEKRRPKGLLSRALARLRPA